jgi:hypothetical protein
MKNRLPKRILASLREVEAAAGSTAKVTITPGTARKAKIIIHPIMSGVRHARGQRKYRILLAVYSQPGG